MHQRSLRVIAVVAIAIVTTLAGAPQARAGGVVNISTCQTLSGFNTVYRLTTDLTPTTTCGDCLVVAADRITIDLQGHSITNTCFGNGLAITDGRSARDLIVVKNGSITGYAIGVALESSTRVSVLGITSTFNLNVGIVVGARGLVKSSEVSGSVFGIRVHDRSQVQQCNAHDNGLGISSVGDNCLITMNTANFNTVGIALPDANKCTVSYNTASNNSDVGIGAGGVSVGGSGHLVTQNVAMNNGSFFDYTINCPSTVTNNTSTNGFPTSYLINGTDCHLANNN
jgi:hypothetical protein